MTTPSIEYHIYLDPSVYYCMITINSVSNVWDVVINVVWDDNFSDQNCTVVVTEESMNPTVTFSRIMTNST